MAKTTKAPKAAPKMTFKTPAIMRKGFRAYVGMYGAAYEAAVPVFNKAVKNYNDYAAKGEVLETAATTYANDTTKTARAFVTKRFEKRSAQLRSFIPGAANDRAAELEAEIAKLNKKIVSLTKTAPKKAAKRVTKVAKTAVKTVKAA